MSKPFLFYIPGLEAPNQVQVDTNPYRMDQEPPHGTCAHGAWQAAIKDDMTFARIRLQAPGDATPTLSEMGMKCAAALIGLQLGHEQPGVFVSSSVGAGVTLQAILNTLICPPKTWIVIEGVFDPLSRTKDMAAHIENGTALYLAVQNGEKDTFPLPIGANGKGGIFPLQQRHIKDKAALRIFDETQGVWDQKRLADAFNNRKTQKIGQIVLLTTDQHPLSPPSLNRQFAEVMAPFTEQITLITIKGKPALDQADVKNQIRSVLSATIP
jgi:hypothetical protein